MKPPPAWTKSARSRTFSWNSDRDTRPRLMQASVSSPPRKRWGPRARKRALACRRIGHRLKEQIFQRWPDQLHSADDQIVFSQRINDRLNSGRIGVPDAQGYAVKFAPAVL